MKRKLLIGIGVVIVVLFLVALILPHFIDANQYKPMLESQMKEALGGRNVSIGNVSITLLPGAAAQIDRVGHLDLAETGFVSPSSGLGGIMDLMARACPFLTSKACCRPSA